MFLLKNKTHYRLLGAVITHTHTYNILIYSSGEVEYARAQQRNTKMIDDPKRIGHCGRIDGSFLSAVMHRGHPDRKTGPNEIVHAVRSKPQCTHALTHDVLQVNTRQLALTRR